MSLDRFVFDVFLVFCRVSACIMIVPGLSSARVPVRVRLHISLALALVIAPFVVGGDAAPTLDAGTLLRSVAAEVLTGTMIGAPARLFIEAVEFAGTTISNFIGLNGLTGSMDGGDPLPAVAALLSLTAMTLLILMDLPHYVIASLVKSYDSIPKGVFLDARGVLQHFTSTLSVAFSLALQVGAPFLIYGVVLNAMMGVLGKIVPQMPTYFVSLPAMALGGLILLYLLAEQWFRLMMELLSAVLTF